MPRQVDLDMIELIDNKLTVDEYLKLRALVGWKKLSREQAQKALDNSLLVVGAYLAGQPIGMGRLVGDGAVICYVQDSCNSAAGARVWNRITCSFKTDPVRRKSSSSRY